VKINLAKSSGFCFGVKRAIRIALETAKTNSKIEMLGDIIHNEDVVRKIEKAGIKKVKRPREGKDKILLIRAHGAPKATIEKFSRLGYTIVDTTCPRIATIHKIASGSEKKGYKIIIIGDSHHDEVHGIVGQLKSKPIIIDGSEGIPLQSIRRIKKAALVVQTTQNFERTLEIVDMLKQHIEDLRFFVTICNVTIAKQKEIRVMPLVNDVMIIVGSKASANTKRLYEISKSLNKKSYWITSKDGIKAAWLKNIKSVGIMAGASTPDTITNPVLEHIRKIN
jgi:4-hydroxy-3-methylbut-2-enyl diphosphate reductase